MNVSRFSPYAKTVVAVAGALVVVATGFADGRLDNDELVAILTAVATAYGVYQARNKSL